MATSTTDQAGAAPRPPDTSPTGGTQPEPPAPGQIDLASLYDETEAPLEPALPERDAADTKRVFSEIKRVIVGQDRLIERLLVALLARGHILLEGVPGLAKTLAIKTVAQVVGGTFRRIQFTPDLVPADLVGTRIYNQRTGEFGVELGPVFANLLLADEINRAPAKVQSALLEVMQERQVTIGGQSYAVPDPFLVLATQNPIEHEGTYQLPEAQVDRFMFKTVVGYPDMREELIIVDRAAEPPPQLNAVLTAERMLALQREADAVTVDRRVRQYAVYLATATRQPDLFELGHLKRYISFGASPRASINLILGARALALLRGRAYVLPEDVWSLAADVLRHRLVLSYEALAEDVTAEMVVEEVVRKIPMPQLGLAGEGATPFQQERILPANTSQPAPARRRWSLRRRKGGAA
ncbi:MAG: AAA family ATPase [Chloroflexota bacterium]